jgi:cytoskeletal protein CcmA (bactofilin family)
MFGKRQQAAASITVIAAGSVVEGTLRARGMVQVDGTIDGALIVGGRVEGTVFARGHLLVLASGVVHGNARYTSLEVERGGVMDGSASRVDEQAADNDVELVANAAAE